MRPIRKYPRTRHIEGSRLQPGDEDLESVPLHEIAGRHLAVEEKIDGSNSAVSFDSDGTLYLQSRGHYLAGGAREKHFAVLKTWAQAHAPAFFEVLGDRYVMYGEWVYAKHTIYYDALPHYFLEFDVLDRETDRFLSTPRRRALLASLPIASVPVLREGPLAKLDGLVGPSNFNPAEQMEGLYIKVEDDDHVLERFKWVRASFLTAVIDSGTHWLDRPIVPNRLAVPFDSLFQPLSELR